MEEFLENNTQTKLSGTLTDSFESTASVYFPFGCYYIWQQNLICPYHIKYMRESIDYSSRPVVIQQELLTTSMLTLDEVEDSADKDFR